MIKKDLPGTVFLWLSGTTACSLCRAAPPAQGSAGSSRMGQEWLARPAWTHSYGERLPWGRDVPEEEQRSNSVLPEGKK